MIGMWEVFNQNIVPIFLVVIIGFVLKRRMGVDKRPLSAIVFNGLSPCLVFVSLVNSNVAGDEFVRLALFAVGMISFMGGIAFITGRLLSLSRPMLAALMISVMFANSGNFGLTLLELRFGADGLARGVIYYVTATTMFFTVGVFIATMGNAGDWRQSIRKLLQAPPVYATVVALLVYFLDIPVPRPIMQGFEIAASGAIPVMLLILGINLAELAKWEQVRSMLKIALPASGLRLLVGPMIGSGLVVLLGLNGIGRAAMMVDAALPTAVITTVLATEYDLEPAGVTSAVFISTLISLITVPAVITLFNL